MTTTTTATAKKKPAPTPVSAEQQWERDFRRALAAVQQAAKLTSGDRGIEPRYLDWWTALAQLCSAYAARPMPGEYAVIELPVLKLAELLRDAFQAAVGDVGDVSYALDQYQGYVSSVSGTFGALEREIARIDNPTQTRRESVYELLQLMLHPTAPLSVEQFLKMCPHVSREQLREWEDWNARRQYYARAVTGQMRGENGQLIKAVPPGEEPILPEFPPLERPQLPPVLDVSAELLQAVAAMQEAFAEAAEIPPDVFENEDE